MIRALDKRFYVKFMQLEIGLFQNDPQVDCQNCTFVLSLAMDCFLTYKRIFI